MPNPFANAVFAALYIALIVNGIFYAEKLAPKEDRVLIPIAMLSLFVLSAAVMGYLFLYQPATLILEGKKQEGVHCFLKTVATFAAITLALLTAVFFL